MILKPIIIDYAAKILLDGQLWSHAKLAVKSVATNNPDLTGEQKKQLAKDEILSFIGDISTSLINLAIEIGVLFLKSQSNKK